MAKLNLFGIALVALLAAVAVSGPIAAQQIQVAYAQEEDPVQNVTALIVSVGGLIGAIATIVSLAGSKMLVKHADNKLLQQVVYHADGLKGTDEALAEVQDDLAVTLDVATKLIPGLKEELAKHGKNINTIRAKAADYTDEVHRLYRVASKY